MLLAIFWLILIAVTPNSKTATHVGDFPEHGRVQECRKQRDNCPSRYHYCPRNYLRLRPKVTPLTLDRASRAPLRVCSSRFLAAAPLPLRTRPWPLGRVGVVS